MAQADDENRRREAALAKPIRRKLLDLLDGGEQDTQALRTRLLPEERSLSEVVYHLRVLKSAGLVVGLAEGRWRLA